MSEWSPAEIQAIKALLYALADDELVIGHRNSEWTGVGPILEEDIAFSSMAQDEIGHAQMYYTLLAELGEPSPDELVFNRPVEQFHNAQFVELPRGDYAFSLVRQALYDTAESVRLEALVRSRYKPLADTARKLRLEERYHTLHSRTWLIQLGQANEASWERLQAALDELFPYALGLFEPTEADPVLAESGIQPLPASLQSSWLDMVVPLLHEAGLQVPSERLDGNRQIRGPLDPYYGGRTGQHTGHLAALLQDLQLVFRLYPGAVW